MVRASHFNPGPRSSSPGPRFLHDFDENSALFSGAEARQRSCRGTSVDGEHARYRARYPCSGRVAQGRAARAAGRDRRRIAGARPRRSRAGPRKKFTSSPAISMTARTSTDRDRFFITLPEVRTHRARAKAARCSCSTRRARACAARRCRATCAASFSTSRDATSPTRSAHRPQAHHQR